MNNVYVVFYENVDFVSVSQLNVYKAKINTRQTNHFRYYILPRLQIQSLRAVKITKITNIMECLPVATHEEHSRSINTAGKRTIQTGKDSIHTQTCRDA